MKKKITLLFTTVFLSCIFFSFRQNDKPLSVYAGTYFSGVQNLDNSLHTLLSAIENGNLDDNHKEDIRKQVRSARKELKRIDFWLRYFEPTIYKQINGPLPVEWETEVFEKYEKPYKREGAGLTLATLYLEEENINKQELARLIQSAVNAIEPYRSADSITSAVTSYHHFFFCNRLFLLNLAAIYTTGFECPETDAIMPELRDMMVGVQGIYDAYNQSFPDKKLNPAYLELYRRAVSFVQAQPSDYTQFNHFSFLKDYVNPLYAQNQQMILDYKASSRNMIDYALNKQATSIFDKAVYNGQNPKGIYHRVRDEQSLAELDKLGKMLFYDPMLSGNNQRSCASCHKPTQYFTDTTVATAFHFDHKQLLPRNAPSLINAQYNHLVMMDGKHISLQDQAKDVITNTAEMACAEKDVMKKVLSCSDYKKTFKSLLQYTPTEKEITFDHIASALTFYYGKYGKKYAPFDEAITQNKPLSPAAVRGFNLFMSKAQCATCHFVPQFNGVKPPFIGSEFEVIGIPRDTSFKALSDDKGRYNINPADETLHAFRTGTVRNAAYTRPYMHNGSIKTLEQLIDFYDAGGGVGRGLDVPNQTLSSDSLKLTHGEKKDLIAFIESLNENIDFELPPAALPKSKIKALNSRKVGGEY